MTERWGEAYEEWATAHRWAATTLGVGTLSALMVVGLIIAGQSPTFALIAGGAVAITVFVVLVVASAITGWPVLFALFGARAGERDPGVYPSGYDGGWFGSGMAVAAEEAAMVEAVADQAVGATPPPAGLTQGVVTTLASGSPRA